MSFITCSGQKQEILYSYNSCDSSQNPLATYRVYYNNIEGKDTYGRVSRIFHIVTDTVTVTDTNTSNKYETVIIYYTSGNVAQEA
jgi:hypothetical protein